MPVMPSIELPDGTPLWIRVAIALPMIAFGIVMIAGAIRMWIKRGCR